MYKLNLSDRQVDMKRHDYFQDRLSEVNEKVFNIDQKYFIGQNHNTIKQYKYFKKQWLGYKIPGKKKYVETIKNDLNNITNYLLGVKDLIVDDLEKEFLRLKRLQIKSKIDGKDSMTREEKDKFNELKTKVLYYKVNKNKSDDIALIENMGVIKLLPENKRKQVDFIKQSIFNLKKEIKNTLSNVFNLRIELTDVYKEFRESKDNSLLNTISSLSSKLKNEQDELKYMYSQMATLCDDYKVNTSHYITFK